MSVLYLLFLLLFFCHFSQFVIWILAWLSSLLVAFTAFFFYLLSFLLAFCPFSSICLFMSLYKSIIIYLFSGFLLCVVLQPAELQYYIYLFKLLFMLLSFMLFCRSLLFLAVFYSCLYIDLFVPLFSMKSLFFLCLISFVILYNMHPYCFNLYFPLIIRILYFYIFA